MEVPEFDSLPVELLEHIFTFVDAATVVNASRVCTKWRAAYLNVVKHKNIFESCCRREITPTALSSVVDKLYPGCKISFVDIDWLRVFKCWFKWKNLKKWLPKCETVIEEYNCHIRCTKFSGDWLIYGTESEGRVIAYNLETHDRFVIYRGCGVLDLELCNINGFKDSRYFPHSGVLIFLKNFHILESHISYMEKATTVIFDGTDCLPFQSLVQWLELVRGNYQLKLESLGYRPDVSLEDTWMSQIQCNHFVSINSVGDVELGDCGGSDKLNNSEIYFKGYEKISVWHQLNSRVTLGIAYSQFHMLFFIVDNKMKAYIPCAHMYVIRSALLHSNVLYLGSGRGVLYAFSLGSDESLLSLRLAKHTWKYKVVDRAIISLDIQYGDDDKPFIVVSTDSSIHKVY